MRKASLLLPLLIGLFIMSPIATHQQVEAQNFDLVIYIPTLEDRIELMVRLLSNELNRELFLNIQLLAQPKTVYYNTLLEDNAWDLAFIRLEGFHNEHPSLLERYSNESIFGAKLYNLNNSLIAESSGIDLEEFQTSLRQIHYEFDLDTRLELIDTFQERMMNEWLFELPLLEQTQRYALPSEFSGFDPEEGLFQSLFLGASWASNPERRQSSGITTDQFVSFIKSPQGNLNPFFTAGVEIQEIYDYIYPSLLLVDKDNNYHPYLAKQVDRQYTETSDGRSSSWDIKLYDNVYWREFDGTKDQKVTATDVKFSLDMYRFNWTGVSSNELLEQITDIKVHNDTDLTVHFARASPLDDYYLAKSLILPEHKLNGSLSNRDGSPLGDLYEEQYLPIVTKEWQDFGTIPTTAGPYYVDGINQPDYVLTAREDFWFPLERDAPNGDFLVHKDGIEDPYYFLWEDEDSTDEIEKPSELPIQSRKFFANEEEVIILSLFLDNRNDIIDLNQVSRISEIEEEGNFVEYDVKLPGSGENLVLNINNPDLQDYDIRKAIYQAIDRVNLASISDLDQAVLDSPINTYYDTYYTANYAIPFDLQAAEDMFISKGYGIIQTTSDSGINTVSVFMLSFMLFGANRLYRLLKSKEYVHNS